MMQMKLRQGMAMTLVFLQLIQPALAAVVPVTPGITQDQAANGVPVVNIATPGAAGVSRNVYSDFSVGSEGLIFNNSAQPVNTQLGGYIVGNPALGAGSARIILNEVNGALPSNLNGYMEVAGSRASVVVANPSGITCNGCGFINTQQATLTTGRPVLGNDGALHGFRVEDGKVTFSGMGLNASNTESLAIYARALELNAELYATELDVVTGANDIDALGNATPITGTGSAPAFSVDAAALGGMYANRIRLVGTEAGVGMRLAAPVAAFTGNLVIEANGDVHLARASSGDQTRVTASGNLELSGDLTAGGDVQMDVANVLVADGLGVSSAKWLVKADQLLLGADTEVAARDDISLNVTVLQNSSSMATAGQFSVTAATIVNHGLVAAQEGATLNADDLVNVGQIQVADGDLQITAGNALNNEAGIITHGGGQFSLSADELANASGQLLSQGQMNIQLSGTLNNVGGLIQGNAGISVQASSLDNSSGNVLSNGAVQLDLGAGLIGNASGLVETPGDITVIAGGISNTYGKINAGGSLSLMLPAFDNNDVGGVLASSGIMNITTVGAINIHGADLLNSGGITLDSGSDISVESRVVSGSDLTFVAENQVMIGETAVVAGQGGFAISANSLSNLGVIYGKNSLNLNLDSLLLNGDSDINHEAAIVSEGDIHIGGRTTVTLAKLFNYASLVESYAGNIAINASDIRNINVGWEELVYDEDPEYEYSVSKQSFDSYNWCCGRFGENDRTTRTQTDVRKRIFSDRGIQGQIVAAGDVNIIADSLLNQNSLISAGNFLDIVASSISNQGTTLTDEITTTYRVRWHECWHEWDGVECGPRESPAVVSHYPGSSISLASILEGGVSVNLHGTVVNGNDAVISHTANTGEGIFANLPGSPDAAQVNGAGNVAVIDATSLPGFHLPGNGLFHLAQDPAHPYLIETDPALNTYSGFLGSAYLLSHLDWAPEVTQRRLGDSYYELMLVRQELVASLGSRFVDPSITDEQQQFMNLMQNAIAASESLHLSPGVSLSREQIDALQQDIIWMEEKIVAGQKVLVPVVYLVNGSARLASNGSIISGGAFSMEGESLANAGLIRSRSDISVDVTGDILNRGGSIIAKSDVLLQSGNNVLNESGLIAGDNVGILAAVDITHRTWSEREEIGSADNGSWSTAVGEMAGVVANGVLAQRAGGDITLTAAQLDGGIVSLQAGGSVNMDTLQVEQGYRYNSSDWRSAEEYVRQLQTQVTAALDLTIQAEQDINLIAARIGSAGSAVLEAGGSINMLAAQTTDHQSSYSHQDGTFSDSSSEMSHDEQHALGSDLRVASDLVLNAARGNITLYGSTASGGGNVQVTAGNGINLIAAVDTVQHQEKTDEQGLATFKTTDKGYISQQAVLSVISAGGNLALQTTGSINLVGADLLARESLIIDNRVMAQDDEGRLAADAGLSANINIDSVELTNEDWDVSRSGLKGPLKELVKAIAFVYAPYMEVAGISLNAGEHDIVRNYSTTQVGSAIMASDVDMASSGMVRLAGSTMQGNNVSISAQDVVLDAVAETSRHFTDHGSETISGLGMRLNSDEVRLAGTQTIKTSTQDLLETTSWKGSAISANNLVINAERNIEVLASQLQAVENLQLQAGEDLLIGGKEATTHQEHREKTETITTAVAVRNAYVDAVNALKGIEAAKEALEDANRAYQDARAKVALGQLDEDDLKYFQANVTAATWNLGQATTAAAAAVASAAATAAASGGTGFYVSGSAVHDKTEVVSTNDATRWQGSVIESGGTARLEAGEKLSIIGSDVAVAGALALDAKNINIAAGKERSSSSSETRHDTQSVSVSSNSAGVNVASQQGESSSSSLHYVNSHVSAGSITSNSESLRIAGAVVEADHIDIATDKLIVASLQDESHSRSNSQGGSIGASFSTSSGSLGGVNGSINFQNSESERLWVDEQTALIGHDSIRIRAQDTTLTGAVIANAIRGENGELIDQGNLDLATQTFTYNDLQDYERNKTIGASVGGGSKVDKSGNQQPSTISVGGTYLGHETERTSFATLGAGNIRIGNVDLNDETAATMGLDGLHRDLATSQLITRDQDIGGLNASVTIDTRWFYEDGRSEMSSQVKNLGTNLQWVAIGTGKDVRSTIQTGVSISGASAKTAEVIEDWVGAFGIVPTTLDNGGILGQIPLLLLPGSDVAQRQMVGASKDSSYVLAHPELGWVSITETPGYALMSKEQQDVLRNVVVSTSPLAISAANATYQNATNGMLNTPALAMYNAVSQTHDMIRNPDQDVLVTLNYNPTRGVLADGIESGVDYTAIGLHMPLLATSVAKDTGVFLNQVMLALGNQGASFANHSQGNLLTYSGLLAVGLNGDIDFRNEAGEINFNFSMYGAPVNAVDFSGYLADNKMMLGASSVNAHDFVGQALGGNSGLYIYGANAGDSFMVVNSISKQGTQYQYVDARSLQSTNERHFGNLFNLFLGGSPHSNYSCVSFCGSYSARQ